ncbi:hypothetical protein H0H93_001711 [Arthromyces matolae]|nr:hypothetical protein H0H93_001711 [Arthromyces matolae]
MSDSVPHTLAVLITRSLITAWSAYAIRRTTVIEARYKEIISGVGTPCSFDFFPSYFSLRVSYEVPDLILNVTALMIACYLSLHLLRNYSSQSLKRVGAPKHINRINKFFMAVLACLQLECFFLVAAGGLWIDVLVNTYIAEISAHTILYKGLFTATTIGWYSIRQEMRATMLIFLGVAFLLLTGWTFIQWPYLGVFTVASLILIIASIVLGVICRLNFGKGLAEYLHAEEALASSNFAPEIFSHDEEKGLGASDIKVLPTFESVDDRGSESFYAGPEMPRPTYGSGYKRSNSELGFCTSLSLYPLTMNIAGIVPLEQKAEYLRTLPAIRERCGRVYELAKQSKLQYFDYHPEKEADVTKFCTEIMKVPNLQEMQRSPDLGFTFNSEIMDRTSVPFIDPHGRWRHLDAGVERVLPLIDKWHAKELHTDPREDVKRVIDLFVVSVLLDAGAGNQWSFYEESSGLRFSRSEGLGVASVHMFEQGLFSSDPNQPFRVDATGLAEVTVERIAEAMQVNESNPMVGLKGRTSLLTGLSTALKASPRFFGDEGRPGNMIGLSPFFSIQLVPSYSLDFLESGSRINEEGKRVVSISALWHTLIEGLNPIWPSRIQLAGKPLGDVWHCTVLSTPDQSEGDDLVAFHKLTSWLTYSIVEALQKVAKWKIDGLEDLTGLPEYRNGGLLVDLGVLTLKAGMLPIDPKSGLPKVAPSHPAIVEWRAMTVIELDRIAEAIRETLGLTTEQLTLAQVLEGATWKGGREIAKEMRPQTGGPPIEIESDGTVF